MLAHRVLLHPEAELQGRSATDVVQRALETVPVPRTVAGEVAGDRAGPMTRLGLGAALAGVAFVVVGWVLVWPALVVVGGGSLVLVLVALAYIVRRPQLRIERQIQPPRVSKGLPAIAFLHFTNTGTRTVPTTVAVQPYGALNVETVLPKLLGGQSGMRSYRLPTTRRGIFDRRARRDQPGATRSSSPGSPSAMAGRTDLGLSAASCPSVRFRRA